MGAITFDPGVLADVLSETAGYKAGLALSVDELCDHLSDTSHVETLVASEKHAVRLRSEDYEDLFYKLLHRIGHTADEYDGDYLGIKLYHKYRETAPGQWEGVQRLFVEIWPRLMEETRASGATTIDPRPFIRAAHEKYGRLGLDMAVERLEVLDRALRLSPHSAQRYVDWRSPAKLNALFKGDRAEPEFGRFIDQRYIDYLSNNGHKIGDIHWRKFEQLTAEFFDREGYVVELGPGSNDDGVDVRIWQHGKEPGESPHCLVQCKRQRDKVERVVVKGLLADVSFEGADFGLVVTTSELSPGARSTIASRGYPIDEVNKVGLAEWLKKLRTPGTGIVRV